MAAIAIGSRARLIAVLFRTWVANLSLKSAMPLPSGYALVTGASSGIGVEFARELASRGFDLIITARRRELLGRVREEICRDFSVEVTVLPNDLDVPDGARRLYEDVEALDKPVTLLVNNAGLGRFGALLDQTEEMIETMIRVNAASLATLTRLFAADMKKRGGGYILNNASFSAIQPPPQYAVYSGTKAFVLAFSQAAGHDLRRSGVRVSVLCPGFFRSEFLNRAGQTPSLIVKCITLDSSRVARAGIAGVLKGKRVIIPGLLYKSFNVLMRLLPRTLATSVADFSLRAW